MSIIRGIELDKQYSNSPIESRDSTLSDAGVLDRLLHSRTEINNKKISTLTGPKTKITYYSTILDSNNNNQINVNDINRLAPELRRYKEISDLQVILSEEVSNELEKEEG